MEVKQVELLDNFDIELQWALPIPDNFSRKVYSLYCKQNMSISSVFR